MRAFCCPKRLIICAGDFLLRNVGNSSSRQWFCHLFSFGLCNCFGLTPLWILEVVVSRGCMVVRAVLLVRMTA
jgi:hypothetical protein